MKKTSNYQLNQWELSDRVQMADFNRDNLLLDAALASLAAGFTSRDTAISSAKADLTAAINAGDAALDKKISDLDAKQTNALNSAKTTLNATISAGDTALGQRVDTLTSALNAAKSELEAENQRVDGLKLQCFHKHYDINTGGLAQPYVLSLEDMPPSQFLMTVFIFRNFGGDICVTSEYDKGDTCYVDGGTNSPIHALARIANFTHLSVGFPMMQEDTPIFLIGSDQLYNVFRSHSRVNWGDFSHIYIFGMSGPAVSIVDGTLDYYGIRCEDFA